MNEQTPKDHEAVEDLDVTTEDAAQVKGGVLQPPVNSLKAGASEVLMETVTFKKGPGLN